MVITYYNKLNEKKKKEEVAKASDTKECPYCFSTINIKATVCPECTTNLEN
ncbi:MAG: hypothetical protein U5K53_03785 [Halanaerobiales bacterium]|nr:hypothetical protein [Halanaerobiales bacterium]